VRVWAMDRQAMLNGSFNAVYFDIVWDGYCCWSLLPSNMRGHAPHGGAPNYFVDAGANVTDTVLHLWKFHVDWTNPLSNSTFTGPITLTVAPYVEMRGNIMPQISSTAKLDVGDDNLAMQLQYRNSGGAESLWATHMISGAQASAIRWYEIRDPNGAPSVHQQGTFSPDTNYRFMPSLAVDQNGNMEIGYSVSGANINPSIRYVGRMASDPLGVLAQGEASLIEGSGAQTTYARWGDYSAMSVDPLDDCTFWYTHMYYATSGLNWITRVGSFKLSTCAAGPTPTPSPTPTPGGSPTPTPTPTPAPTGPAVMLVPPPGATFTSPSVTFQWSHGSATAYGLTVGSSPSGSDIYSSSVLHVQSATVNNVPNDGRTI